MSAPAALVPRVSPDLPAIRQHLDILSPLPGQVIEIRALGAVTASYPRPHVESGYFNDLSAAAQAAARLSAVADGVYATLNLVRPDLLSRSVNRTQVAKQGTTTADSDIQRLRLLLIDIDPVRPAGISSTDREHDAAIGCAKAIARYLVEDLGWPGVLVGDSANGAHVKAAIDLLPEDRDLVKACLEALAARFDSGAVKVDRTTHNPARISKIYGTVGRKGDPTPDRPHRLARIISMPHSLEVVPREALLRLAATAPARATPARQPATLPGGDRSFDIEAFISRNGLTVDGPHPWQGGRKYILPTCPWDAAHDNRSAFIIQMGSGAISAGCHHNGCADRDWRGLRALYEPAEPMAFQAARRDDAELAALRASCSGLREQLAEAQAEVDRLALDGSARTIADLQRQVACERIARRSLVAVLERRDLTPQQRVLTGLAMDEANAYRVPATLGDSPALPEPRRVAIGALEARAGVGKGSAARALKAAATLGLLTRTEVRRDVQGVNGAMEPRLEVLIGPGTGQPAPQHVDLRRQQESQRKADERQAQQERVAALAARVGELEAAQARAIEGCPLCGGDLLPTGYFCCDCSTAHTPAQLLSSHPPESGGTEIAGGVPAGAPDDALPIPENPGGNYISTYPPDSGGSGDRNTNRRQILALPLVPLDSGGTAVPEMGEDFFNTYHDAAWYKGGTARAGPAPPAASGRRDLIAEEDF